jgi:acyl-CoA reductase-like NAD-dependent aldehyde dehydrogenase
VSEPGTIEVQPRPCWIAGHAEQGERTLTVLHPYDGTEVADVAVPGAAQVERAVTAAADVAREFAAVPAHERAAALQLAAEFIADRAEEIAETITAENGKPLKWAHVEVDRAAAVFRLASEETGRLAGDVRRLDSEPTGDQGLAMIRRKPRGPVLAVAPSNFPLNLVAHKVAAAIAVGAPVVVTPASATPMTALLLGEILADTDLTPGAFSILPGADLVADPRLPVVSFTGSTSEGRLIADAAQRKHVVAELGGSSAVVVCSDWSTDDDLDTAAGRIAIAGTSQAGQSSFAVRQVIVHSDIAEKFVPRLVDAVRGLAIGDPHDPEVEVGPLINSDAAQRVVDWIAVTGGTVLTGGTREGTTVAPTVLGDVPADAPTLTEEVFGPVLVVSVVDSIDAAFALTKATSYGVFTRDIGAAFQAAASVDADRVVIGNVPAGNDGDLLRSTMLAFTREQVTVLTDVPG